MSKQDDVECKNHVISIIMKIDNEAHIKLLYKYEHHKNLIYIKKKINFKAYVCFVETKSLHTYPKHK